MPFLSERQRLLRSIDDTVRQLAMQELESRIGSQEEKEIRLEIDELLELRFGIECHRFLYPSFPIPKTDALRKLRRVPKVEPVIVK